MLSSVPAQAAPFSEGVAWSPALLSTEPLHGGSVLRLRYTDGITVVAPKGAQVVFEGSGASKTLAGGRQVYDRAVRVVDPNVVNAASLAHAAADYAARGRSIYDDALAAGYSAAQARQLAEPQGAVADEPPVASTGCVRSEDQYPDPDYEWSGCYKLYAVTDADEAAWYAAGSGTAHGWGTGVLGGKTLVKGASQISWTGSGAEIIEASPAGSVASSNCRTAGINLAYIIEVSYSTQLCADGWNVT